MVAPRRGDGLGVEVRGQGVAEEDTCGVAA